MAIIQCKNKKRLPKDGRSWYYQVYYKDIYGNIKEKHSKYYKTKTEAKNGEREFLDSLDNNTYDDNNITLYAVIDEWFDLKKNVVKSTTAYGIELYVNKHIKNFFNRNLRINEITVKTLNLWKTNLSKTNMSKEYQNQIITYFQDILKYAVENYNYDNKIASKLQKYRLEKTHKVINDAEKNYWTYEEFNEFISCVNKEDSYYYVLFNFLYYTGLRFGEMAALNWNDIDFRKKTLRINKSLTIKIKDKIFDILDPKTNNSNRIIDLDDNLIELLKEHKEHEKKIYGFNDDMFVFGNVKYVGATTFRRKLNEYIKIAKVKKITPHGFRHSHASFLINIGCDSRDVAERLGDTVSMVEKTYYHMFPEKKSKTINAINQYNLYRTLYR